MPPEQEKRSVRVGGVSSERREQPGFPRKAPLACGDQQRSLPGSARQEDASLWFGTRAGSRASQQLRFPPYVLICRELGCSFHSGFITEAVHLLYQNTAVGEIVNRGKKRSSDLMSYLFVSLISGKGAVNVKCCPSR